MRTDSLLIVLASLVTACSSAPPPTVGGEHGPHHHGYGKRFEKADEWTKVFDDPARDAWQRPDAVVALLELKQGMTVADIGAGTGYFMERLSKGVGPSGKVLELDVEADLVRFMRERATKGALENVRAELVPLDDPKLDAGKVDRILVVDTWHHIGERAAYTKKLHDALAPGGFVAVVDFKLTSDKGPPKEHRLDPLSVANELAGAGLTTRVDETTLPDQYVVFGTKR